MMAVLFVKYELNHKENANVGLWGRLKLQEWTLTEIAVVDID